MRSCSAGCHRPGAGRRATYFGITSSLFTRKGLQHILLPALNLALLKISLVIRLTRAGTREAIHQDYIKFARAKGLSPRRVIGVHLLKNILIPVVTVLGLEFGNLVAFSVVTETIFAWPGMGKLLIGSIQSLDRPVIVAYLIMIVLMFVVINLVVDILYSRARSARASRGEERMSLVVDDPTVAPEPAVNRSPPKIETPFRRFVVGLFRQPRRAGRAAPARALIVARAHRAVDRAAEPL